MRLTDVRGRSRCTGTSRALVSVLAASLAGQRRRKSAFDVRAGHPRPRAPASRGPPPPPSSPSSSPSSLVLLGAWRPRPRRGRGRRLERPRRPHRAPPRRRRASARPRVHASAPRAWSGPCPAGPCPAGPCPTGPCPVWTGRAWPLFPSLPSRAPSICWFVRRSFCRPPLLLLAVLLYVTVLCAVPMQAGHSARPHPIHHISY